MNEEGSKGETLQSWMMGMSGVTLGHKNHPHHPERKLTATALVANAADSPVGRSWGQLHSIQLSSEAMAKG